MNDDRIFYGPHPCEACGGMICKASRGQGGEEFDYPEGPIYPNTPWSRHACVPVNRPKVPAMTAPEAFDAMLKAMLKGGDSR